MSYYHNLQKAIDHIEHHLDINLTMDQIAAEAGYSISHFYRVFTPIVGCSVKEYIRRRRLSKAMFDILTTNTRITDIAFQYGFESHEAFTRSFKLSYGFPPSSFRKKQKEPPLFEKINLLSYQERNELIMTPEIICKEEKHLLGIVRTVNQAANLSHSLIGKIRTEFEAMASVIENRIHPECFYAAYDYDPADIHKEDDEIDYLYYFCVEVPKDTPVIPGMVTKVIPQGKYAVFQYEETANTLNGEPLAQPIYDYIDGLWLPNSGYELAETSDYEEINQERSTTTYYISIR